MFVPLKREMGWSAKDGGGKGDQMEDQELGEQCNKTKVVEIGGELALE